MKIIHAIGRFLTFLFSPYPPPPPPIANPLPPPPQPPRGWPELSYDEALARQRSGEMAQWYRPWEGNGTVKYNRFMPQWEWDNLIARGGILHDHPHSRPATFAPCPECRFPQFGWGGLDHWPECSQHYSKQPR